VKIEKTRFSFRGLSCLSICKRQLQQALENIASEKLSKKSMQKIRVRMSSFVS